MRDRIGRNVFAHRRRTATREHFASQASTAFDANGLERTGVSTVHGGETQVVGSVEKPDEPNIGVDRFGGCAPNTFEYRRALEWLGEVADDTQNLRYCRPIDFVPRLHAVDSRPMRIATWNVNSIRRRASLVAEFLAVEEPDVLCLQEIKCGDAHFPRDVFHNLGYELAVYGDGGYGGVAIASRIGLADVSFGFGGQHGPPFDEPRLLAATVDDVRLMTVYAPNGRTARSAHWRAKLAWFELLAVELELELAESANLVIAGDFNVCPSPIDVYDPVKKRNRNLVSEPERAAIAKLLNLGLVDLARTLHPNEPGFSWFAFSAGQFAANRGYRLDLVLASAQMAEAASACQALRTWREPDRSPSDHTPVVADFGHVPS